MAVMDDIEYIESHLCRSEILAQLAEESAELAQAALKLRRAMDDVNPTPVTEAEAWENLIKEYADVSLCLGILLTNQDAVRAFSISREKAARWRKRLEEHHG